MIKSSTGSYENQDRRSLIKNISSRMKNLSVQGAGLSKWEADVLVDVIEEVYFAEPGLREISEGQVKRNCFFSSEGKEPVAIKSCSVLDLKK